MLFVGEESAWEGGCPSMGREGRMDVGEGQLDLAPAQQVASPFA